MVCAENEVRRETRFWRSGAFAERQKKRDCSLYVDCRRIRWEMIVAGFRARIVLVCRAIAKCNLKGVVPRRCSDERYCKQLISAGQPGSNVSKGKVVFESFADPRPNIQCQCIWLTNISSLFFLHYCYQVHHHAASYEACSLL